MDESKPKMSNSSIASGPQRPRIDLAALKASKRAEMAKIKVKDKEDVAFGGVRGETGLIYHGDMLLHRCVWDPQHIESPARLERVWERCSRMGLVSRCTILPSREALDEELLTFHDQEFLNILKNSKTWSAEDVEVICGCFDSVYFCPETDRAARLAAGGAVDLVQSVLSGKIQNGMGLIRPPGHHAMTSTPCGFCGFNNIVIAANSALNSGLTRILIVDFDLHHGQGTQQAFYDDPRVVYMSVHRYEKGQYWPHLRESNFDYIGVGSGKGFNVNVALNSIGCGPEDYLAIFQSVFLPIGTEFQPQLVLVSAGYDAAIGCPEGEMMVTPATYPHLLHQLSGLAGGRIVALLEGGYCLDSLEEAAALSLRQLLGDPCPPLKGDGASSAVQDCIRATVTALREHWRCLSHWRTPDPLMFMDGKSNTENIFLPKTTFEPPVGWPPTEFPTREYYLVHSDSQKQRWVEKIASLVLSTTLRCIGDHKGSRLAVMYDSDMTKHQDDEDHPECPQRIVRIWCALKDGGVMDRNEVQLLATGRKLTQEEAELVHDTTHWKILHDQQSLTQDARNYLTESMNSIFLNEHSLECGLLAAGGVLATVDAVLSNDVNGSMAGLAVVRPPGHHAEPHTPHGFCLFNNIGIAAQYAVQQHGVGKVLILDWDVHHGNGIQHMFYNSSNVLYISIHRYDYATFFPCSEDANYKMVGDGTGEGFNVNIPFNSRKMGDSEYLLAFQSIVLPIAYEYQPDLVLISAGFDAAEGDPLGGYKVTPAMFGYMTQGLMSLASSRVVLALEGGYCLPAISESALQCARALLGDPLPNLNLGSTISPGAIETVRDVIKAQAPYWKCLRQYSRIIPENMEQAFTLIDGVETIEATKEQEQDQDIDPLTRSFRQMDLNAEENERTHQNTSKPVILDKREEDENSK